MKRILVLALLMVVLLTANVFAANTGWALGGEFSIRYVGSSFPTGAALCLKFPSVPVMFGFSAYFGNVLAIGATADWWLLQTRLVGPLELYLGPGLFLSVNTGGAAAVDFGIRVPVGLQIYIVKAFEIFLEPALTVGILPVLPSFGFQGAIGFRFWF